MLGPLAVTGEDGDRTPRGQRARDLLAVMLLRRERAVPPDVLLDLVWGAEAPELDVAVVHTQVARLRRAIGSDVVVTTPTGYLIQAPVTDADRFLRLLAQAQEVSEPDRAVALLDEARGLWRGPTPYAGVSEGIAEAECARLIDARLAAEELLVEQLLAGPRRQDALRAQEIARDLVQREPLRERAHELAIFAAARLDEQAEALRLYEDLRTALRDELGVDPGRSVQQLHARVLDQDPALLLPRQGAPARARGVAPPTPVTGLVGRERELAHLLDTLAVRRVVTLTGHGGVGKTRLVLAVAEELAGRRELCFVDLSTIGGADREAVVEAIARTLGAGAVCDADALCESLRDRSMLVILDEAEHAPSVVAELVTAVTTRCSEVDFLVTSRTPLEVLGEVRVPLGPLAVPGRTADLAEIRTSPAVRLLLERLHDHTPDLVVEDDELALAGDFARRLDGLPLAIELAAGYAGSHALGEIDDLLGSPLDLSSTHLGRPERHRSLRQALGWTYDRLPEHHRRVLRRLSVFAGPFDLAAVGRVVGADCGMAEEVEAVVRSLARESLIQIDRQRGELRFRLLRTVRDLMLERVEAEDDLHALRARHRQWFASPYAAGGATSVLGHVQQYHDDHVAALDSAVTSGDAASAVALLLRLATWWEAREMDVPARRWTTRVLDTLPLDASREARVRALRGSLLATAEPDAGRADMLAALPQLELDADGEALLLTHAALALELTTSGEHDQALGHAAAAVAAARRWLPARLPVALAIQASVAVERDPALAEEVAGEAFEQVLGTDVGDDIAAVSANVAWALFGIGRAADGLTVVERGIAALPRDAVPTYVTIHRGWGRLLVGEPAGALGCFVVALAGEAECETRWHADVFTGAGCALAALADDGAATLLEGAARLVDRTGHVLAAWQRAAVDRARSQLPPGEAPWTPGAATGAVLAELVRVAAARHAPESADP